MLASPILGLRLGAADAGTDAKSTTTRQAYDLLAKGFGPGFNGPMQLVTQLPSPHDTAAVTTIRSGIIGQRDVAAVAPAIYSPNGRIALINVIPKTAPRDAATSDLLTRLRNTLLPPLERRTATTVYVGGTTALFADFSSYLAGKLPLFIGAVVLISALLLLVVFRSLFVAAKAIVMNLLSVAAAFGVVVAVFQWGWLGGLVGISTTSPIAAFLPVMVFAIVFTVWCRCTTDGLRSSLAPRVADTLSGVTASAHDFSIISKLLAPEVGAMETVSRRLRAPGTTTSPSASWPPSRSTSMSATRCGPSSRTGSGLLLSHERGRP